MYLQIERLNFNPVKIIWIFRENKNRNSACIIRVQMLATQNHSVLEATFLFSSFMRFKTEWVYFGAKREQTQPHSVSESPGLLG